jgi:hypothetical protein
MTINNQGSFRTLHRGVNRAFIAGIVGLIGNSGSVEARASCSARGRLRRSDGFIRGGGVKGGRVVGRSDPIGAVPAERPVEPAEVVATIFHSLGFDLETKLPGPAGRPFPLAGFAKHEIKELF